jgi:hypothetical protein
MMNDLKTLQRDSDRSIAADDMIADLPHDSFFFAHAD